MTLPENEDELRGELARIGPREFRKKHGPRAHVTHPMVSFSVTKHILDELDRADQERHDRFLRRVAVITAVATVVTAIAVVIEIFQ